MAFEGIDVGKLYQSLGACSNSLNCGTTQNLIQSISSGNTWSCASSKNLTDALSKLLKLYDELRSDINKYQQIANQIGSYKKLQNEIKGLEDEHTRLQSRLYYNEQYDFWYMDPETEKWYSEKRTRRVKDYNVEYQMSNIKNQIRDKESEMQRFESYINSHV